MQIYLIPLGIFGRDFANKACCISEFPLKKSLAVHEKMKFISVTQYPYTYCIQLSFLFWQTVRNVYLKASQIDTTYYSKNLDEHRWLRYGGCFELVFESPGISSIA